MGCVWLNVRCDASTIEPMEHLQVGTDVTAVGRVRSKGVIPTRKGLRIFQAVLQDDSGMITCAWPGQPWLERKLHEGDLLLVTGRVKFFHGRQLQPREFTVLARASDDAPAQVTQGHVFATYPASEEVQQACGKNVVSVRILPRHIPVDKQDS